MDQVNKPLPQKQSKYWTYYLRRQRKEKEKEKKINETRIISAPTKWIVPVLHFIYFLRSYPKPNPGGGGGKEDPDNPGGAPKSLLPGGPPPIAAPPPGGGGWNGGAYAPGGPPPVAAPAAIGLELGPPECWGGPWPIGRGGGKVWLDAPGSEGGGNPPDGAAAAEPAPGIWKFGGGKPPGRGGGKGRLPLPGGGIPAGCAPVDDGGNGGGKGMPRPPGARLY